MAQLPTLPFRWLFIDGNWCMVPLPKALLEAKMAYVENRVYWLDVDEQRSMESHNHYFASIADSWNNLPEAYGDRFATPEHLRKWCLIKAGFRNEKTYSCGSEEEAQRLAVFVKGIDDYAVVVVRSNLVIHYTAKTQKMRGEGAMNKAEFQASKQAVLDLIDKMLEFDRGAPAA